MCLSVLFSNLLCAYASSEDDLFSTENFGDESITTYEQLETTNSEFKVQYMAQYGTYTGNSFNNLKTLVNFTLGSGELNHTGLTTYRASASDVNPIAYYMRDQFVVYPTGDLRMASKGESISFSLDNVLSSMIAWNSSDVMQRYSYFNPEGIKWIDLYVYDKDKNGYRIEQITDNFNVKANGVKFTIGADFDNLPCDVYAVNISIVYDPQLAFNNNNGDSSLTATNWAYTTVKHGWGYDNSHLTLNVNDNTAGLLSSIIAFIQSILEGVQNIFTKIGDFMTSVANSFSELFSKLGTWFSNLISSIIELPSKIWTLIENGLKSLFVPDETFIQEYKNDWDIVLSDRFGAIYQSVELLIDYVSMVDNEVSKGTITLPSTSIDLPDGAVFTFGGYDVKIVPEGFGFLADAVKFAVDVVCSFAVINALKRRFERVMEG